LAAGAQQRQRIVDHGASCSGAREEEGRDENQGEKRGSGGGGARQKEKLGFLGIKKGKERAHALGVLGGAPCREKRRSVGEDNKEHSR
jgi:hypothetical protein